ncbi:rod shape determining protein RodA [Neolewinella xylanilytica]|uniref:Rod shape determining protein RodA n=1 Tax=Neolewinella xylanilytica TaxID=1514080 RepID=A0A2S6I1Q3_9BACT|nr:rod shape-determining protein RodA [Neolewinella xylanilytica]PPK85102.1 rod shape determining protein RodA [Neolewinella xylanilytica]
MGRISLKRSRTDVATIILYLFLVLTGLLMIHSVGSPPEGYEGGLAARLATPAGKQFFWLLISGVAWLAINYLIDRKIWVVGAYPVYVFTVVLLLLVLIIGKEINGAKAWFSLGGLTFQPSELAKFGTCLGMAAFMSQYSGRLDNLRNIVYACLIWLIPAVVILGQPDMGSTLVFIGFLLVMYREGLTPLIFILGGFTALMVVLGIMFSFEGLLVSLIGLCLLLFAFSVPRRTLLWILGAAGAGAAAFYGIENGYGWQATTFLVAALIGAIVFHLIQRNTRLVGITMAFMAWGLLLTFTSNYIYTNKLLPPHQHERIGVWLHPEDADPRGSYYNLLQSKLAIAAGGVTGRGLMEGTMTKYDYVPEQLTDFIFSAVGEEQGFIGAGTLIVVFFLLLWRITVIAERQRRTFSRAYAYGVAGILLVHFLVNVGMTMGVIPVIGIPLPFISKGGSSLLSFTLMLAVMLKLDKHRGEV